ncbi:TonB-dependent receptor [Sphingobacterium pedocola]|uniref:TonB-dependent receptor n=1 Tax=Sphingobacterium pedocola TaxID=2082722 RepID=A0ABR9T8P2_9SPHI|nr:TonB-dependent receptor [Sphingobacterium pedocola]MBE8721700.1 TonB-dependent receptor [Sphingobacterium pedocola]
MYEKITFPLQRVLKTQVLMRIQLTLTIIIFFVMQVGARSVAQHHVTLQQNGISMKEVFREIKKQTDRTVFYSAKRLNDTRKVNINLKNATLETVMDECLKGLPLTYVIMDKTIVLKEKETERRKHIHQQSEERESNMHIQENVVTGTVRDANGTVLAGISVSAEGTTSAVATSDNGSYSIAVKSDGTLIFQSVGFVRKEEAVRGRSVIDITLEQEISDLDEVVVVGYGTVKKSDLTGAVNVIDEQTIRNTPAANIAMALQGAGSGVNIQRSGGSTHPAHTPEIRIRGTRSIAAGNDPLLVVDGIPYDLGMLNNISPDDITSVTVLKDASSTAIYGSRGANGVILMTTKRGVEAAKAAVTYNGYVGVSKPLGFYDAMNSDEYMQLRKWSMYNRYKNSDSYTGIDDPRILQRVFEGGLDGEIEGYDRGVYTDWQKELYDKDPVINNHQIGIAGGSKNTQYATSLGYFKSTGIYDLQSMERATLKLSMDHTINKYLKLGFNTLNTYYISRGESLNPMGDALSLSPLLSPYLDDGSIREKVHPNDLMSNPLMDLRPGAIQDDRKRLSTFTTGYLDVDFTHGFKYRLNAGVQLSQTTLQRYYQQGTSQRRQSSNYGYNESASLIDYTIENLLTYDKKVEKHNFNVTALFSAGEREAQDFDLNYENVPTNQVGYYNPGTAENHKGGGEYSKWSMLSYMGRLNYDYDQRYYLTTTLRADGSSRLAQGNKWHYFPSAALAWNIGHEQFMERTAHILSQLKLRLSYGEVGNTNVDPYDTMGNMSSNRYIFGSQGVLGYYPTAASNRELKWERTASYNAGIDFGFLKNRVTGSIEAYKQYSNNLMMNFTPPATSGVSTAIPYNVGKTENVGFETNVRMDIFNGDGKNKFQWSTDLNIYFNRNKVVQLTEGVDQLISDNLFVGHPLGSFYEYVGLGIWQDTPEDRALAESFGLKTSGDESVIGTIKVSDISGPDGVPDDIINDNDRKVLGSHQANFEGGWTNTLAYKNFDFTVVMNFRQGGLLRSELYGGGQNSLLGGYTNNLDVDYWTPENTGARWPAPNNRVQSIPYKGTLTLFDASYLKIRTVTLGYTLPDQPLRSIGLSRARIYATATNPLTFFSEYVNKYKGLDPETNRVMGTVVPPSWQMLFGINITF